MLETDNRGINQLLLSPLFLLDRVLGTLAPGVLLLILLVLKGNELLKIIWLNSPLGYKTKIALMLFLSYIAGTLLKLPSYIISRFAKRDVLEMPETFEKQTPEVTRAFYSVATDGVLWSSPRLLDKLSISKAEVAFHVGVGVALIVASAIPGDGLRLYELLFGLLLFGAGVRKARDYGDEAHQAVVIAIASTIGNMSAQQILMLKVVFESLKKPTASGAQPVQDIGSSTVAAEPSPPTTTIA